MFSEYLGIIEAISTLGERATKGAIQKMNIVMTVGQVERRLKMLEADGYIECTVMPYGRTGKKVYHLSNVCTTNIYLLHQNIERNVFGRIEA